MRGIDSVLWLLRFNQLVYWLWFSIWLWPSVPCVQCWSVYLIRKYVILYQHCQDTSPCPVQLSCPGRHRGVRGMVLAFVCWLQGPAVLQCCRLTFYRMPAPVACCRLGHDAVSPVSSISRQQPPIIVVTVLLGDNHHHCGEQEELRIVDEAPDMAPPCRGHTCWLLYLELFILIWLGVIIEPCSAPTHHSPSCYAQPHSGSQIVF